MWFDGRRKIVVGILCAALVLGLALFGVIRGLAASVLPAPHDCTDAFIADMGGDDVGRYVVLSIYTTGGQAPWRTQYSFTGHAWLILENDGTGRTVGHYLLTPYETISIGSAGFSLFDLFSHSGVWINIEASQGRYVYDATSISVILTEAQMERLHGALTNDSINRWNPINNCTYFAKRIWNYVVPALHLNAGTSPFFAPMTLKRSMRETLVDGVHVYLIRRPFCRNENIGFFRNSRFINAEPPPIITL